MARRKDLTHLADDYGDYDDYDDYDNYDDYDQETENMIVEIQNIAGKDLKRDRILRQLEKLDYQFEKKLK